MDTLLCQHCHWDIKQDTQGNWFHSATGNKFCCLTTAEPFIKQVAAQPSG